MVYVRCVMSKSEQRRMTSTEEAKVVKRQHRRPCVDCPFLRSSIPGWLGGYTAADYHRLALSDAEITCHALVKASGIVKCAGHSIFRANVAKVPRFVPGVTRLVLPTDRAAVLGFDFLNHHTKKAGS